MESIGAFEAKTHLAELPDRVAQGERITITRHGVPAALLDPVSDTPVKRSHAETIREMIEEGRRF